MDAVHQFIEPITLAKCASARRVVRVGGSWTHGTCSSLPADTARSPPHTAMAIRSRAAFIAATCRGGGGGARGRAASARGCKWPGCVNWAGYAGERANCRGDEASAQGWPAVMHPWRAVGARLGHFPPPCHRCNAPWDSPLWACMLPSDFVHFDLHAQTCWWAASCRLLQQSAPACRPVPRKCPPCLAWGSGLAH